MSIEELRNYEDLKNEWYSYIEQNAQSQYSVLEIRNLRAIEYLGKAKEQFVQLFEEKKFQTKILPKRIQANYLDLKYKIFFEEPNNAEFYEFGFSILRHNRKNYNIVINTFSSIPFPKGIRIRSEPPTTARIKHDIKLISDEYINWQKIIEMLKSEVFCYQCYDADNTHPNYETMKKYSSFLELLNDKLNS